MILFMDTMVLVCTLFMEFYRVWSCSISLVHLDWILQFVMCKMNIYPTFCKWFIKSKNVVLNCCHFVNTCKVLCCLIRKCDMHWFEHMNYCQEVSVLRFWSSGLLGIVTFTVTVCLCVSYIGILNQKPLLLEVDCWIYS